MACNPEVLKQVPLFALLDEEELAVLAGQIGLTKFEGRQRIYKRGELATRAYVVLSGAVRISTVDEDQQEVVVDQPGAGEFFGFASMITRPPVRPAPSPSKRLSAWRWNATTSRFCWNASRSRGWIY